MTTSSSRRGRNRQRGPHGRPDAPERHHQDLVLKRTRVIHTIGWHEIPHWQRDNEFILTGYRRLQNQWWGCFKSIFAYIHNESVNIHTHLWGAVVFLYFLLTLESVTGLIATITWADTLTISVFLLAAAFTMGCSSLLHTANCHSQKVSERCNLLDYFGIVVLIEASCVPSLYYAFYCSPKLFIGYISMLLAVGVAAASVVLDPTYTKPTHRGMRTAVFIGLGLSTVVPFSHALYIHGLYTCIHDFGGFYVVLSGVTYIAGALLYANRIPERFYPGRFDLFMASHQLFHVCVFTAAYLHYVGVQVSMHFSHGIGKCVI